MEELYLVYINKIGTDWVGKTLYEFLFSTDKENIDGEDWDAYPASGNPSPPNPNDIHMVGKLSSDLKFDLVQYSDTFAVWDAVDGIIALGWEDISDYEEYPERRLYFSFGETKESIDNKLYEKDLILEYNVKVKKIEDEN